jgi:hypothetical protein
MPDKRRVNQALTEKLVYSRELAGLPNPSNRCQVLFIAQGDHRINAHGAARRYVASRQRNDG